MRALVKVKPGLRLRAGPGMQFRILDVMPYGTVVEVHQAIGAWWVVFYRGRLGYAYAPYLALLDPQPVSLVRGVDLSFSSIRRAGADFLVGCRAVLGESPSFIIQNLWTGFRVPESAEGNLEEIVSLGFRPCGYIVFNPHFRSDQILDRLHRQFERFRFQALFLDVEPTPNIHPFAEGRPLFTAERIREWVEGIRIRFHPERTGIYTAQWVWVRAGKPDWSSLASYPFWVAHYDGRPVLEGVRIGLPEWRLSIVGKQYRGTTVVEGRWSVDLNVFRADFWGPEPPHPGG